MSALPHRLLQEADIPALQELMQRCEAFFLLTEGEPAPPWAAREALECLPPGRRPEHKKVLGYHDEEGVLRGVADLVWGYPRRGSCFIGLLLLDPAWRGGGRGAAALRGIEELARAGGAHTLRLAVLEQNEEGLAFWLRMGFREVERTPPMRFGALDSVAIRMERELGHFG